MAEDLGGGRLTPGGPAGTQGTRSSHEAVSEHYIFREQPVPAGGYAPVRAIRGTVILSSLFALREMGHFANYRNQLTDAAAADVLAVVAGSWISLDLASAHYEACEALRLNPSLQLEIGQVAGRKAIGTMLGTAVRLCRHAGATPWSLLAGAHRIWSRAYDGGGLRIVRLAQREALMEVHGHTLFGRLAFSRNSYRGFCMAFHGLVAEKMSIREVKVTPQRVDFRLVWT